MTYLIVRNRVISFVGNERKIYKSGHASEKHSAARYFIYLFNLLEFFITIKLIQRYC